MGVNLLRPQYVVEKHQAGPYTKPFVLLIPPSHSRLRPVHPQRVGPWISSRPLGTRPYSPRALADSARALRLLQNQRLQRVAGTGAMCKCVRVVGAGPWKGVGRRQVPPVPPQACSQALCAPCRCAQGLAHRAAPRCPRPVLRRHAGAAVLPCCRAVGPRHAQAECACPCANAVCCCCCCCRTTRPHKTLLAQPVTPIAHGAPFGAPGARGLNHLASPPPSGGRQHVPYDTILMAPYQTYYLPCPLLRTTVLPGCCGFPPAAAPHPPPPPDAQPGQLCGAHEARHAAADDGHVRVGAERLRPADLGAGVCAGRAEGMYEAR